MVDARRRRSGAVALLAATLAPALAARPAAAQTDYYNTDAGRPVRVEDATVIERHAFELEPFPLAMQRSATNFYRYKVEPHIAYGILPMTQVEVGAPFVVIDRGSRRQAALAGIEVHGMHSFNLERSRLPAFAMALDILAPVGGLAPSRPRGALTGMATRTFRRGRLHLNAEYQTMPGRRCEASGDPDPRCQALFTGQLPPVVIVDDLPCLVAPAREEPGEMRAACSGSSSGGGAAAAVAQQQEPLARRRLPGVSRWMVGVGADRALPLRSLLLAADMFVEWNAAGGVPADWTAEGGIRYQLSPRSVLAAGAGSQFRGRGKGWFLTFGTSYAFAVRRLMEGGR